MNILYHLQNLHITGNNSDKSGRVDPRGTLDESDISNEMLKRGTGLTKQEILGVIDLYTDVLSDQVRAGFAVNTRLANFRPGIKGVFGSATDPFDPERHFFRASITEGVNLKKKMRTATGERTTSAAPKPFIIEYNDHGSSQTDQALTPGSIGEINGQNLKFDPQKETEGIFFVNQEDGSQTRVQVLSLHTESRLMLLVPDELTAGEYKLEVRRAYTRPTDIRTGRLNAILSVATN